MQSGQFILPRSLAPKAADSLIRLGKDHDGGYLIDQRNLANTDLLISLGISDDWSFESSFHNLREIPIWAFDASISQRLFLKEFLKSIPRVDQFPKMQHRFNVLRNYRSFFQGSRIHVGKHIGIDMEPSHMSFSAMLDMIMPASGASIFFKIDIEGWEYRILDDLLDYSASIEGMVLEFHDVDLHLDRIIDFVKRLPLTLCHLHSNNYYPVDATSLPMIVECSFTRQEVHGEAIQLSGNPLDQPNCPNKPDYQIRFT